MKVPVIEPIEDWTCPVRASHCRPKSGIYQIEPRTKNAMAETNTAR